MNHDYAKQEEAMAGPNKSVTVDSAGTDMGTLQGLIGMAKAHG